MKKRVLFSILLLLVVLFSTKVNAQLLLNEQFNYASGDSLTGNGWSVHSAGINTIKCTAGSLTYTGYATSLGNKAFVNNSGQDIFRNFTAQPAGTNLYMACLINVATATATADYFLHLKGASTTTFFARIYIKKDATLNKYTIGILKGSTAANIVYGTTLYDFGVTNLIVLKYSIVAGATNDPVSLFVNPATASEGSATITASDVTSTDLDLATQGVALRQGTAGSNLTVNVDEIRVATTWSDAIGNAVITAPVVTTSTAGSITSTTATCNGNVTSDGGAAVTERGICYGTTINPDITGTKVTAAGTTGAFSANLSSLTGVTTYHYRAYATNSIGTSYGSDLTFITAASAVAPVVTTDNISNISTFTATANATVTNDGGSVILARGICWGTSVDPSLSDNVATVSGTTGSFSGNLTNLNHSTIYHVRAFATNAIGTTYGADLPFTTIAVIPTYTISQIRTVNATTGAPDSLNVNCRVQGVVHGVNLGTTGLSFFMCDANSGINVFRSATNLGYTVTEGDLLNVMGKIANYNGLIEIVIDSLVKISSGNPTNTPLYVTNLDETTESRLVKMDSLVYVSGWPTTSANANVTVTRLGQTILLRVYGTSNLYTMSAPSSMFTVIGIGNQFIATSPYFGGYQLSPRYVADVLTAPRVTTVSAVNVTSTSAKMYSNLIATGGSAIIERGIIFNNNQTIAYTPENGATGIYSITLNNLIPNTTYHYKAYATNAIGTTYGADTSFTTLCNVPESAGAISGNITVCKGQTNVVYTVPPIVGAETYVWTLPAGMTGYSTTNTISVNVNNSFASGIIEVLGSSSCYLGQSSSLNVSLCSKYLAVKVYLESLFDYNTSMMNKVQDDNGDHFAGTTADVVTVQLAATTAPYATLESFVANVSTSGEIATILIPSIYTSSYYLVVKHRNSIETWSANPISFTSDTTHYDFTNAATKAYSDNLKMVAAGKYAIITGDVDQDGVVNIFDLSSVFDMITDPFAPTGYLVQDINGDSVVNIFDLSYVFDNILFGGISLNPITLK